MSSLGGKAHFWVCCVPCAVCRVGCAVCRVLCGVCRVPCGVCRVPCAVWCVPCAVCGRVKGSRHNTPQPGGGQHLPGSLAALAVGSSTAQAAPGDVRVERLRGFLVCYLFWRTCGTVLGVLLQ